MRVLIDCEFSGVVRRAFRAAGHEAWSRDLLPSVDASPFHIIGDARAGLPPGPWDLYIAHPPCTRLCNSGVRWLFGGKGRTRDATMFRAMQAGADLFAACYWADVPRVAVENPIMHGYARDYLKVRWKVPGPSQTVQPWQFGHGEVKRTAFWLRGLVPLQPTHIVEGRHPRVHHESPGPDRWKRRSVTYEGIAAAMVAQWGAPK